MTRWWVSGVFFFPHILQSRSCRNRQPRNADRHKQNEKTKNPAFSKQDKQGRQPREIHLDNNCFTQGAHHRKNKGFILICTSKGRVENRARTRWPPSTLWDGVREGGRRWGPSPAPRDNGAILPWRVEGHGSSKEALLPLSAKGVWVEVSWEARLPPLPRSNEELFAHVLDTEWGTWLLGSPGSDCTMIPLLPDAPSPSVPLFCS